MAKNNKSEMQGSKQDHTNIQFAQWSHSLHSDIFREVIACTAIINFQKKIYRSYIIQVQKEYSGSQHANNNIMVTEKLPE